MSTKKKYVPPYIGKQTVQSHPDPLKKVANCMQVSTYNGDSWFITMCSSNDVGAIKEEHLQRLDTPTKNNS